MAKLPNTIDMKCTITTGEAVVLSLETYDELASKARMLDSIVLESRQTINLAPRHSSYSTLSVECNGGLILPTYVKDQLRDGVVEALCCSDRGYLRDLVENDVHLFNLADFDFESYRHEGSPLEVDLMGSAKFRRLWDEVLHAKEQQSAEDEEPAGAPITPDLNPLPLTLDQELDRLADRFGSEYLAEQILKHPSNLAELCMQKAEASNETTGTSSSNTDGESNEDNND